MGDAVLTSLIFGMTGTGLGGLIGLLIKKNDRRLLSIILEFSAGLMMAVSCFQLLPEGFSVGGPAPALTGACIGIVMIVIADDVIGRHTKKIRRTHASQVTGLSPFGNADSGMLRAGLTMAVGIALHNFPEGFAVGSGFEASPRLGLILAVIIAIHDVPEGIAMCAPMRAGGFSAFRAVIITAASAVPTGIGALLGVLLGSISQQFIAGCLGFAAGAMIYVVVGEIIPESKTLYRGRLPVAANIAGMLCGMLVSMLE